MNGIIRYLANECGGNVHDKGAVIVTGSSESKNDFRRSKNAIDLDDKSNRFVSKNKEDSWLKYDLKEHKVNPTHYSIQILIRAAMSQYLMAKVSRAHLKLNLCQIQMNSSDSFELGKLEKMLLVVVI